MDINLEILMQISSYFSKIAHTPGRLRVRVDPKIKDLSQSVNLGELDSVIAKINGIKNVKFNKIIGSVTIEYDNEILPKILWDDLLEGQNLDQISVKINNIAKEVYCA
ncbi:hypothetical protein CCAL13119_08390 [Campylobacter sp. RM13119]|uniref:HMA2 domain-containing protein n=1 Tax=Campylobacter californiensis TaxID=1032243 RepID=UPI001475F6B3|nr:hypothetical protein [Campylobacter sp. RM13119]MBE3606946.1 hypothetical protein [Campylobacter sp. RM13119]